MEQVTDKKYWMDGILKSNLDTLIYNIQNDWDFMLLITGDGMVRVGKSELGQQVGYYVAHARGTPFSGKNVCFSGQELREKAHELPKNSVLIYDEARGELDNKKLMEQITKNLLDFFAECGMYNHLIIIILPDYFELPKGLAINRSDALINVFRTREEKKLPDGRTVMAYARGHFQFFDRKTKKLLYIKGKKEFDNYDAVTCNFYGTFRSVEIIDKEEYLSRKKAFIQRNRHMTNDTSRFAVALKLLTAYLSQREIAQALANEGIQLTQPRINQLIKDSERINTKQTSYDKR